MNITRIYYFTGTGNSLAVARKLAEDTNAELIGIPAALKTPQIIPDGASVGIVYPLYAGGLPNMVVRFLKSVSLVNSGYVFFVATEGGKMGAPASQISRLSAAAGHIADSCWWIQMPDNYIPLSEPPKVPEQKAMYDAARSKTAVIAESVNNREKHIEKMGFAGKLMSVAYGSFMKSLPKSDEKFLISARCTKCGICVSVCPADNIILAEQGKHLWHHRCEGCLACLHFCPEEAINIGKKTELRSRYRHPSASVADMLHQKNGE